MSLELTTETTLIEAIKEARRSGTALETLVLRVAGALSLSVHQG